MAVEYTKVELAQEVMWRKCAADPVYFFENFWFIRHPEAGPMLFKLYEPQLNGLQTFRSERYVITLKARQIGWTTLVAGYAFWVAFFQPDRPIVFLSKGEREAMKILAMVTYGHKRLPDWMLARGPRTTRSNQTVLEFDNSSAIESLPSKSDPARGGSYYLAIVDEWAFLENPEEAWASIEPIVDVGGRAIGLSTAKGWGNFFHSMWVGARTGTNDFVPIFEPWDARGDRSAEWYESKRRSLPEWQLHQEYPRTEDEAFIQGGNPFFDVEKLAKIEPVKGREGVIVNREFRTFVEQPHGNLEVWDLPVIRDKYVVGADVAEGLEHGDYSSAHVLHVRTGKVVAHWHGHIPPDEYGEILSDLGHFYNKALIGVENNNHGLTTCVALRFHKYPNVFYSRIVDERTKRVTPKMGWSTTKKTRPLMLDDLYASLRDGAVEVLDKETIGELRTFIRDENARLHGSPFDDRTMSLAITEQMRDYARQHDYQEEQQPEWGSLQFWANTLEEPDEDMPIGAHNVRVVGGTG